MAVCLYGICMLRVFFSKNIKFGKITLVIQKKNEGETEKRVAAQRKLLLLQVEQKIKSKIKIHLNITTLEAIETQCVEAPLRNNSRSRVVVLKVKIFFKKVKVKRQGDTCKILSIDMHPDSLLFYS